MTVLIWTFFFRLINSGLQTPQLEICLLKKLIGTEYKKRQSSLRARVEDYYVSEEKLWLRAGYSGEQERDLLAQSGSPPSMGSQDF